ncbi:MAG: hypothetical protein H7Z73_08525 [Candidatus Saccharibacteria bacterium]|nr:hypothetical protein [Moraxellaceae bacterium]
MTTFNTMTDETYVAPQIDQELDRFCLQVAIECGSPQLTFFNKLEFLFLTFRNKPMELPSAFHLVFSVEFSRVIESVRGRLGLKFVH